MRIRCTKDLPQKYIVIYCIKSGSEIKCNLERAVVGLRFIKTSPDVTCDDVQSKMWQWIAQVWNHANVQQVVHQKNLRVNCSLSLATGESRAVDRKLLDCSGGFAGFWSVMTRPISKVSGMIAFSTATMNALKNLTAMGPKHSKSMSAMLWGPSALLFDVCFIAWLIAFSLIWCCST